MWINSSCSTDMEDQHENKKLKNTAENILRKAGLPSTFKKVKTPRKLSIIHIHIHMMLISYG